MTFVVWVFAGILAGAFAGLALFVAMMMRSDSEAIGQGMFLVVAWIVLIPIGACIGFTRALVIWEKRATSSGALFEEAR
jgi:NADH:ubiquinone oxidoreductase subunit 6 (subunit J)